MGASDLARSDDAETTWDGYSDYQAVSQSIAESVGDAMHAYAWLQGAHKEGAQLRPPDVAEARADILGAALKLYVEMQEEHANGDHQYDDILARWGYEPEEGDLQGEAADEPFVQGFVEHEMRKSVPGWVFDFVQDIRTAGLKLGYLRAGRRERVPDDDPVQAEAEHMLRGG